MEWAGKKPKRVVFMIKAKIDIYNSLECGEKRDELMKEYD
jgi:hypothetical protein